MSEKKGKNAVGKEEKRKREGERTTALIPVERERRDVQPLS